MVILDPRSLGEGGCILYCCDESMVQRVSPARAFFSLALLYAVKAAITWHIHPSRPPDPIQSPGVTISQKMPRRKSPL